MKERRAALAVFASRVGDVLDLVYCLANRENDDPLVMDARNLVAAIEREEESK